MTEAAAAGSTIAGGTKVKLSLYCLLDVVIGSFFVMTALKFTTEFLYARHETKPAPRKKIYAPLAAIFYSLLLKNGSATSPLASSPRFLTRSLPCHGIGV